MCEVLDPRLGLLPSTPYQEPELVLRVSNCVGHSLHVPNVTCELGNVVEMTNLAWSVLVGIGGEWECQWFVVCKNIELTTFDEVAKVLDGKVHCKELSVKCAVPGFWWTELSGEIGN